MTEHQSVEYNLDEKYVFSPGIRKTALIAVGAGVLLVLLGIVMAIFGGGHEAHGG